MLVQHSIAYEFMSVFGFGNTCPFSVVFPAGSSGQLLQLLLKLELASPTRKALITLPSFSFASLAHIYDMQCDVMSCIDIGKGLMEG